MRRESHKTIFFFLFLLLLLFPYKSFSLKSRPHLPFSFFITNTQGEPLDGEILLRFTIIDEDGIEVHGPDFILTDVLDGSANVQLGNVLEGSDPFTSLFLNTTKDLRVKIEICATEDNCELLKSLDGNEFFDINSALFADNAKKFDGHPISDFVLQSQNTRINSAFVKPGSVGQIIQFGENIDSNITIEANIGQVSEPFIQYNTATDQWEVSHNGTTTATIGAAGDGDVSSVTAGTGLSGGGTTGDLTLSVTAGGITSTEISDDTILEVDLKSVDAPADEECLTYEATTGDFEWQSCGTTPSIQAVYDTGNIINLTNARDLNFVLTNLATDPNFVIDISDGSSSSVSINRLDGVSATAPDQLLELNNKDISGAAILVALKITAAGSGFTNVIDNQGTLISGAELNRLDGLTSGIAQLSTAQTFF